uniref:Uncharacterized protein n=1 Tax=Acrobeloides nanus TaxID=290746 RepID=A0A914EJX8_9BILA
MIFINFPTDVKSPKTYSAEYKLRVIEYAEEFNEAKWEEWMVDSTQHTFTRGGKMRHASYLNVCNWILKRWEAVSVETIQNGFRKSLNEEVEENEESSDESEEESDDEDRLQRLELLPEEILEAFDNLHLVSDDDFDGFD